MSYDQNVKIQDIIIITREGPEKPLITIIVHTEANAVEKLRGGNLYCTEKIDADFFMLIACIFDGQKHTNLFFLFYVLVLRSKLTCIDEIPTLPSTLRQCI